MWVVGGAAVVEVFFEGAVVVEKAGSAQQPIIKIPEKVTTINR